MSNTQINHTVVKGECAWTFAKQTLQKQGKSVTNRDIVNEMRRLAQLNDCQSIDDFNNKFFGKINSEFRVYSGQNIEQIDEHITPSQNQASNNDSTKVNKQVKKTSLKNKLH